VANYNTSKNTWEKNRAERPTQTAQRKKIKFRFRAESAFKLIDGIYFYKCGV
jgi:hypothetical protein